MDIREGDQSICFTSYLYAECITTSCLLILPEVIYNISIYIQGKFLKNCSLLEISLKMYQLEQKKSGKI